MMAARQINYASIFGSYVMKTQFELIKERIKENDSRDLTGDRNDAVIQETVEDYIEQA